MASENDSFLKFVDVAGSSEILKEAILPISYYIIGAVLASCSFLWLFIGLIYHFKCMIY